MTEIRRSLYINDLNLEEVNRTFLALQDRLDELEGRRGSPALYGTLDMQKNPIVNLPDATTSGSDSLAISHILVPRAWAYVNSAGTLLASENVASINHTSTGDYTVKWSTLFSSVNYCVIATVVNSSDDPIISIDTQRVDSVNVNIKIRQNGNDVDSGFYIVAWGAQ